MEENKTPKNQEPNDATVLKPSPRSKKPVSENVSKTDDKTTVQPRKTVQKPQTSESTTDKTTIKPRTRPQPSNSDQSKSSSVEKATDKTTVKPRKQAPPEQSEKAKVAKDDNIQHAGAALTRIQKSIREQDNSTGFAKAKQAANRALAEDKIILNKRFVLEETLGAGGMGTVYRARDLRKVEANDLKPDVAVKVLNDEFKNHPDAFVTLQREASRSHILAHPNIVTVHDFDRDDDVIYMTMELLEGLALETLLRQHRTTDGVDKEQAFAIIREIGGALAYAHEKGIIHSDLKPGNVFITDDGAKVLDFGIARVANESAASEDFDAGSLGALTPSYASLEMINMDPPDASDDIYATAIMAYELLSGKHPYDRKPADQVLAENMRPERIKGLNNREWKALEKGLEVTREKRTKSIDAFIRDLTDKHKVPVFKITSAVLLIAASALIYINFFAPDELSQLVEQNYAKADTCFKEQNYACTIESSRALLEIAPNHTEAQALLAQAQERALVEQVKALEAKVLACLEKQDTVCARTNLLSLKNIAPQAPELITLQAALEQFEQEKKIQVLFTQADTCYGKKDLECALQSIEKALSISPENSEALNRQNTLTEEIRERDEKISASNKRFKQASSKAQSCFAKNDFQCAINFAKKALVQQPQNAQMQALQQNVFFAQKKQEENKNKAERLLEKAQKCFRQKNYSCTIANAESALEFIPSHPPAIKLRDKAQDEVAALKRSISIE